MKKCKILFIISMALMLFFVTFGRNKVYANKINNLETSDYDAKKTTFILSKRIEHCK